MKRAFPHILSTALVIAVVLVAFPAGAVTLTGSTGTALVSQPVSFTSTIRVFTLPAANPPTADLSFDFGDGTAPVTIAVLATNGGTESHTRTHSFSRPGTYTVSATGVGRFGNTVQPPATATFRITVFSDPLSPRQGKVGEPYSHDLARTAAERANRYQLAGGRLPSGVSLAADGRLEGIPREKGSFPMVVRITAPGGGSITRTITFDVDPGDLRLALTPERIDVTRMTSSRQRVTFRVVHPTVALEETIRSPRGEFLVGGRVVGHAAGSMSIDLSAPQPSASETVTVPESVLRAAARAESGEISYRRVFSAVNLNSGAGEARVVVRSAAAGDLRITRIRLYFEQNNRPIIQVLRNQRDLTAVADIHYYGSGTFKGYWSVDGRILKRIQKNVYYGKVMTLKTPSIPPLPTYSEGGHRVQFIITEPEAAQQIIDFPVAVYHVEARKAEQVEPITLLEPVPGESVDLFGNRFDWSDSPRVATYRLEFSHGADDDPFFKVFTRESSYALTEVVAKMKFAAGGTYLWRVKGFDGDGDLVAESVASRLRFAEESVYVPGEVIFSVDNSQEGESRIADILLRYDLEKIDQVELVSIDRILVLCRTESDVEEVISRLNREKGLYHSQPNYIFKTMEASDPLRNLQSIDMLLDLDALHRQATGKGVVVAVIDTGVDIDHGDLRDRIVGHRNFVRGSPYQGETHGTAVAGLIAGSENGTGILGIAPESGIFALRACHQLRLGGAEGKCYTSSLAAAIDTAIQHKVDIVNLSLGAEVRDDLIAAVIGGGYRSGITFVAPAGNDAQAEVLSFPASLPEVVSVAGFGEQSAPLPNRLVAKAADAVAPATNIFTTVPGGGHNFFEGTSFSAAMISGLGALYKQKNGSIATGIFPRFDEPIRWQTQVARYIGME